MKNLMIQFTCWFSKKFWDVHSEKDAIGYKPGDVPMHFYEYTCKNCGEKFGI